MIFSKQQKKETNDLELIIKNKHKKKMENLFDPIILFFVLGFLAAVLKSDIRLPDAVYQTISIFLLLSIGLKGGKELYSADINQVFVPALLTIALGIVIPIVAYQVAKRILRFSLEDSSALACHYGSTSAVTFALAIAFLINQGISYEGYSTVLLILLEIPGIAVGIFIFKLGNRTTKMNLPALAHEIFFSKSLYLLLGGLLIGWISGPERLELLSIVFFDPFKGVLAFFMLEMGILTAGKLGDLKKIGWKVIIYAIAIPLISSMLGITFGLMIGLSQGGTYLLAVLSASASYIAAPASVRIAIPNANPTVYLSAAIGVTFPFNVGVGIPLYLELVKLFY